MNIIVAADTRGAIGYQNKLIYHIKEDMQYFKEKTTGKIVVMGRKTFESLPKKKALENRVNIIFTRRENFFAPDCIIVHSMLEFNEICRQNNFDSRDIFIIGGKAVYELFLPLCDTLYLTEIYPDMGKEKECDTYFVVENKILKTHSEIKSFKDGTYRFSVYDLFTEN